MSVAGGETNHPDDTCQSGLCGGTPYKDQGIGFCCDQASAASNCSKGCEAISGTCTAKASAGETCRTSADCYGGGACLDGTCCAFSEQEANADWPTPLYGYISMVTPRGQGFSNCTACSSVSGDNKVGLYNLHDLKAPGFNP
jgi:hypothetical protein